MDAPAHIQTLKLSNIGPRQFLDERLLWNIGSGPDTALLAWVRTLTLLRDEWTVPNLLFPMVVCQSQLEPLQAM